MQNFCEMRLFKTMRSFFNCRNSEDSPFRPQLSIALSKITRSDSNSITYENNTLRQKLENIRDPIVFLKAIINHEKNDPIRNILNFEKLLDHNIFIDQMVQIQDEDLKNDNILPNKYYQDSFVYLKLKAELILKQNQIKKKYDDKSISNHDYIESLLIFESTLALLKKTLDIFSFSFYLMKKEMIQKVIEKRINVYKKLFSIALKEFTILICRIDLIKEEKYREELEAFANKFFQINDKFLITMSNLSIVDEEVDSIEEFHRKNLKSLVTLTRIYISSVLKKNDNKKWQTLELIKIRFQEAISDQKYQITFLQDEVKALVERIISYKKIELTSNVDDKKKHSKGKELKIIKESKETEVGDFDSFSDEDNFKKSVGLSTIKELSSNYDNVSNTTEGKRVSIFMKPSDSENADRLQGKHVMRTSFNLIKKNNFS